MSAIESNREEMLRINEQQKKYYEQTTGGETSDINGTATNNWRNLRQRALHAISVDNLMRVFEVQREWLGDLSGKKVLELGSGAGTPMTERLIADAGAYHALDLSESQIAQLGEQFGQGKSLHLHVGDFLSEEAFPETDFDVIYANSVFHHFRYMDVMLDTVRRKLKPGGHVVTYDPLQTWLPSRMLRVAYRPFQTDADWEHPFTRQTEAQLAEYFEITNRLGFYGKSKWAMLISLFHPEKGRELGDRWFEEELAVGPDQKNIWSCLNVSYLLTKPTDT